MKQWTRYLLIGIACFSMVIGLDFFYIHKEKTDEQVILVALQNSLPLLKQNQVIYFTKTDWCMAIQYGQHEALSRLNSDSSTNAGQCNNAQSIDKAQPFNASDTSLLNQILSLYGGKINGGTLTYDDTGKIVKADFTRGHYFPFFPLTPAGYVYQPNYQVLPADLGDTTYERINGNNSWYSYK